NQLHFLAMSQGLCRKQKLFTKKGRAELGGLPLGPWASRRREELLKLLGQRDPPIAELDRAVLEEAQRREDAVLLMTHPGIGPVTSLAFVLAIGPITRFHGSKRNLGTDGTFSDFSIRFRSITKLPAPSQPLRIHPLPRRFES
ncbi:MAG: transposase, partial [Candidatus Acidiferrum sp.]